MTIADVASIAPPTHVLFAPQAARTWASITVRPGDTVWALAIAYRTTPQALVAKNGLSAGGSVIHAGQRLLVPVVATAASTRATRPASPPRPPAATTHVVRPGETMWSIAAQHRVSLTKLLAANRLRKPGIVHVGQRILVPVLASPRQAPRTPATSANTFAGRTYPAALVAAAAKNRATLAARQLPSRTVTADMIRRTAIRHGVDPKLALAISWQESGWSQRAVSVANAIGAMQVIPSSGEWASSLVGRRLDLLDTQDNITAGVVILRALRSSAGSREEAIAGYYQGLRSVRERGMFADTKQYVAAVLAHYNRF